MKLPDILRHLSQMSGKYLILWVVLSSVHLFKLQIYGLHFSLPRLARNELISEDEVFLGAYNFYEKIIFPSRGRKDSGNSSPLSLACSLPWNRTCWGSLIKLQDLGKIALSSFDPRFLALPRLLGSDHSWSGNCGSHYTSYVSSRFYILLIVSINIYIVKFQQNTKFTDSAIKSFSHLSNLNLTRNGNIFFIQMSSAVTFRLIQFLFKK
jgi:hypothetical protein